MVDPHQDLEQERAADYQTYSVSGTHWEIGRELGQRFHPFGPSVAGMHPDHVAFARACRTQVERVYPALTEEIDRYAEGAGRAPDDLIWHYCLMVGAPSGNCSSVGVMTPDGPVVARNYDFFYFERWRHLVTARPEGALAHTGMWTGLAGGRFDGVNTANLWVAIHGGGARRSAQLRPGVAFHHICRILLETCASAREAVDSLVRLPHIASYNYFVADNQDMYVVEAHPERTRVREPVEGILVCTNHPLHPDMIDFTESPILENSRDRMAALLAAAREAALSTADPAPALMTAMQDHRVPVCGHTDGLATFWSAICHPGRQQVAYSLGAPCRNSYAPAHWPYQDR